MLAGRLFARQCSQRLGSGGASRAALSTGSAGGGGKKAASGATGAARKRRARRSTAGGGATTWVGLGGVVAGGAAGAYYFDLLPGSKPSTSDGDGGAGESSVTGPDGEIKPHKEGGGNFAGFVHGILDYFRGEGEDEHDGKLLPDYEHSVFFQEGAEPPLTLVVDLEETLGTSTWDRRHGWRFVKRPGLDYFLHQMARCGYEVVVFSTNPSVGAVEDTLALLDPDGQFIPYKLYVNAAAFRDERYVKDFTHLNRDFKRVVVVDDNLADVATHRENCIEVRAFDDISVTDDDTLLKLGVYLQTLAAGYSQGQIKDVRQELRRFQPQSRGAGALGASEGEGERKEAAEGTERGEKDTDFLGNFSAFLEEQKALRDRARQRGASGILRKRNLLGQQQPPKPKPQRPSQPMQQLGLGAAANQASALGLVSAAAAASGPKPQYRKTIWERMTDPSTAEKQDKDIQEKEQQWMRYAQQQTSRR